MTFIQQTLFLSLPYTISAVAECPYALEHFLSNMPIIFLGL